MAAIGNWGISNGCKGKGRYEIRPDKTDENVVCMGEFILEPGEEIVVYAQNGVKVVMTPEEV